jgi:cation:H+ antiporter
VSVASRLASPLAAGPDRANLLAMLLHVGMLVAGAAILYFGAEWLVKGAAGLARVMGVSPLVVGLTVVAYGTSMPELVVSTVAAFDGRSAIALGNIIGSNVANLGLILAVTALIAPVAVQANLIRRELPALLGTAAALPLLLLDGVVSRVEGSLLLAGAAGFTLLLARTSRRAVAAAGAVAEADAEAAGAASPRGGKASLAGLAVLGLACLIGGGKLFVDGASGLALALGMSERLVGLTIVAIGTSLPELAASVVAAVRGHSAIAVGNVIGSNVFNVLFVLGGAAVVHPVAGSLALLRADLLALGTFSVLGAILLRSARRVTRIEGAMLAAGYVAFLVWLALGGG